MFTDQHMGDQVWCHQQSEAAWALTSRQTHLCVSMSGTHVNSKAGLCFPRQPSLRYLWKFMVKQHRSQEDDGLLPAFSDT